MALIATAPKSTRVRAWAATALLAVTAVLAGDGFVQPLCYWQGRTFWPRDAPLPMAWSPASAPLHGILLALSVAWLVLWLRHASRARREGLGLAHAIVPAAVFAPAAWMASEMAWACNIF